MSEDESIPRLCRCGAQAGEDWEYCSRECGTAAAFRQLTGQEPTSPLASKFDFFSDTSSIPDQDWWYQRLSVAHDNLTIESFLRGPEAGTELHGDRLSRDCIHTSALDSRSSNITRWSTFSSHSRSLSVGSEAPFEFYAHSGWDKSFCTPATSTASADDLTLPTATDNISYSRHLQRRPARSNLRSRLAPCETSHEVVWVKDKSISRSFSLRRNNYLQESGYDIGLEQDGNIYTFEGPASPSSKDYSSTVCTELSPSDNEDVLQDMLEPRTQNEREMAREDSFEHTVHSLFDTPNPEGTIPPPTSITKILGKIKKAPSTVFANLTRKNSKRSHVNVRMEGTQCPPSPSCPWEYESSSSLLAAHTCSSEFPESPRASSFFTYSATPAALITHTPKLTEVTPRGEVVPSLSTPAGVPRLGPGNPLYLRLREDMLDSEGTVGEEDDDGWDTFVAIQRMREQWNGPDGERCWDD